MRRVVRHVFAAVVLVLFVVAGFWQIHRLHDRQAHNRQVRRAMAQRPLDLNTTDTTAPYRRVTATGRYDESNEILLRQTVLDDTSGNDLLTPLVLRDGRAVLVDRGWVPLDVTKPRSGRTSPVATHVKIEGLVLPAEHKRVLQPDIPKTGKVDAVNYVNVKRIDRQLPYRLDPNYVLLQKQRPANKVPRYEAPPELTEGPHRAYAVQWFLFFVVGAIGYAALLRKEHHEKEPAVPGGLSRRS